MRRIRLVYWNHKEAEERLQAIEDAGYFAELGAQSGRAFLRELADDPP